MFSPSALPRLCMVMHSFWFNAFGFLVTDEVSVTSDCDRGGILTITIEEGGGGQSVTHDCPMQFFSFG